MKEADKEQYLKRGTLAVLGVMKDLLRFQTPLMVTFSRGQFISRMLDADKERIIFDLGSNNLDNEYILSSHDVSITAETHGARVEFSLTGLEKTLFEGLPAFSAPLPELLWQIQRREFFRISAPLEPTFYCHSEWPNGKKVRFRLQDLSLGGIGVLVDEALPDGLNSGDKFKNLRVELGEYGQFEVGAQLLHIGERSVVSSKNETRVTPRLSFRFTAIEPLQERQLQQVIFALERLARDKANRFQ
ncbi:MULTISPECIES: flagellar regulator YcgR PilZN domain-containing protein [unclassified Pantoea]|uniref:flagellar brake protein n=1 Tax=unclassified Pantoea TaxID=2630326 RepID=UPI002892AC6B|nr:MULTISPECIES: flagellar regulator YcgR PilZN domain-containing protein [unclassified Pantoea]MCG7387336.1 flagellar brake protein [Pantoea sp. ACRSB]